MVDHLLRLGKAEDVEHELHDLEGDIYGTVVLVMSRPISRDTLAPTP